MTHLQAQTSAAVAAVELDGADAGIQGILQAEEVVRGLESVGLRAHGIVNSRKHHRRYGEVTEGRRTIARKWRKRRGHRKIGGPASFIRSFVRSCQVWRMPMCRMCRWQGGGRARHALFRPRDLVSPYTFLHFCELLQDLAFRAMAPREAPPPPCSLLTEKSRLHRILL